MAVPNEILGPRPENADLIFIGGTGRSGTHVLSHLLGSHSQYARVPIECRFHCNPQGFPDLLSGRVDAETFLKKLKKFWWRRIRAGEVAPVVAKRLAFGRKVRGLHKIVPQERFDAAVAEFEANYPLDLEGACRNLFFDLLWPLTVEQGKPGLTEMSCFTIAESPTLQRLFPDAKLIHTVRDGRDAGASKVGKRQKRDHPRDGLEGIAWWERRLRRIDASAREVRPGRLLTISLDELAYGDREGSYRRLLEFLELDDEPGIRAYFDREVTTENAHRDRWRAGLSDQAQEELRRTYEDALERLAADGVEGAAELRRTYERTPA